MPSPLPGGEAHFVGSLPWELPYNERDTMNTLQEATPVCRMVRWFSVQNDAERELEFRLNAGWNGSMRSCAGIWLVDVVRPLKEQDS